MKEIKHKVDYRKLFEIATQEEMVKARKELGWPSFQGEIIKQSNKESWRISKK